MELVIDTLPVAAREVEVVERKGLGHPDTICDALAEQVSGALCRYYLERFGRILHHNVDKALLVGGRARPAFGGGDVLEPIDVYLAGRAVARVGDVRVPIDEIAVEAARSWLSENLRALDAARHVRIHCLIRAGSVDLTELFGRSGAGGAALANDTSCGVGFAPLSRLERLVLELERHLNAPLFRQRHPANGEDVKVMAVRGRGGTALTVARALIDRHLTDFDDYLARRSELRAEVERFALAEVPDVSVSVNAGDGSEPSSVFLTVTGTSAEAGDDGQVGRGNRASGLITPHRPMTLEAAAGKNPVSHVGKLYNVLARRMAESIVRELVRVEGAECLLVSRIGHAVTEPQLVEVRLAALDGRSDAALRKRVREIVGEELATLPSLWKRFVSGEISVY